MDTYARWVLVVEHASAGGNVRERTVVLAEYHGTRAEAEAIARDHVRDYRPRRPMIVRRRTVLRTADGWLLLCNGAVHSGYAYNFRVCAVEWDSDS